MQLYARHTLPVPLRVEAPADGPDIFACASEDGKTAVLFAINSRKAEPVDWSCKFHGFAAPLHAVKAETMRDTQGSARQIDIVNHWNAPDRIKTVGLNLTGENNAVALPALSVTAIECAQSREAFISSETPGRYLSRRIRDKRLNPNIFRVKPFTNLSGIGETLETSCFTMFVLAVCTFVPASGSRYHRHHLVVLVRNPSGNVIAVSRHNRDALVLR